MNKISPSILSADFAQLKNEIERVNTADMLHIDVMDGHFVENISFGMPILASVRSITDMFLDVHLMISRPDKYIDAFVKAGADLICFHIESESDTAQTIKKIKSHNKKVAIALKPGTKVDVLVPYIKELDMVLVMTVEPGFGGQSFMMDCLPKIQEVRKLAEEFNPSLDIQVDGGIVDTTGKLCVQAGATVLVAGSYVFNSKDSKNTIEILKNV